MGSETGDSFPSDLEPNVIQFGSKSKGKLSPRSYPIQFERKWKYSFLSVFHAVRWPNKKKQYLPGGIQSGLMRRSSGEKSPNSSYI